MTLLVFAYRRAPPKGGIREVGKPTPPRNQMGGFESWRHEVWGSDALRELGLTVIPGLRDHDVYAEGEDLDRLEAECERLLAHLPELAARLAADEDGLRFRIENFREAIRIAREVPGKKGGVYIG